MSVVLGTIEGSGKTLDVGNSPDTLTASKPSDVVDGDYILAVVGVDNGGTSTAGFTTPGAGWEEVNVVVTPTNPRPPYGVWYKKAASEGSSYSFDVAEVVGTLGTSLLMLIRVSGADATTFLSGTPVAGGNSGSVSPASPSVTTADANACVVSVVLANSGATVTANDSNGPSGMTVVYFRPSSVSSSGCAVGVAFAEQAGAGASGTKTWTNVTTASQSWSTLTFAIKPAVTAGASNITDVSDATPYHGQTGITVTGTNFNAAQGDGEIYVCSANDPDDASAVNQTVTAWGDTEITITAVLNSFPYDTDLYLFVRNSDEEEDTTGFVIQRSARIYFRDTNVVNLAGTSRTNLSSINWRMWSDATLATTVDSGTGEAVDASSDIEIGPITQGSLDPNSTVTVYLGLTIDGAAGSESCFLGKVELDVE